MNKAYHISKSLLPRLLFLAVFICIAAVFIAYARGYRFSLSEGRVTSTGILNVSSQPKAAKVYVNGELNGATDVNITLPFGQYKVEVKKEGYTDWSKNVSLKGEIVMSLDAHLFSKNPSLTPLTNLGINKAIPVGNTEKILLVSETGDAEQDGIYLFESGKRALAIFPPLKLLMLRSLLPADLDVNKVEVDFDPNYRQAILTFALASENENETNSGDSRLRGNDNNVILESEASRGSQQDESIPTYSYLISLEDETTQLFEVTGSKDTIIQAWNEDKNQEVAKIIETLPEEIQKVASDSFQIISLSPNEKRLLYRAKTEGTLPLVIDPPLIGSNQTAEERNLEVGGIYVYDQKEDKNFRIPVRIDIEEKMSITPTPTSEVFPSVTASEPIPQVWNDIVAREVHNVIQWYPTSDYIVVKEENNIVVMQYDGDNKVSVYSGPFNNEFFTIAPDWNLVVLINLNPQNNEYGDLYSIGIR